MSRLMTSLRAAARGTRLLAAEEEPSGDENMEADTPPAEEAEASDEEKAESEENEE